MNTRIQVEHPVTEMVTGVDLVQGADPRRRRRAAAAADRDVRPRGHAIECRINAEDPDDLRAVAGPDHAPSTCPAARACASTRTSTRTTSSRRYYDSLIAKLIVHGRDRDEAIARMRRALEFFVIEGMQDHDPAPPRHPARPRLPRRPALDALHGALPRSRRPIAPERVDGGFARSTRDRVPALYAIADADVLGGIERVPAAVAAMAAARPRVDPDPRQARRRRRAGARGRARARASSPAAAALWIDDRADLARSTRCPGVHVGQDDLPPRARARRGRVTTAGSAPRPTTWIRSPPPTPIATSTWWRSVRSFPPATRSTPIRWSGSTALRRARALTAKPLVAIGGIDADEPARGARRRRRLRGAAGRGLRRRRRRQLRAAGRAGGGPAIAAAAVRST